VRNPGHAAPSAQHMSPSMRSSSWPRRRQAVSLFGAATSGRPGLMIFDMLRESIQRRGGEPFGLRLRAWLHPSTKPGDWRSSRDVPTGLATLDEALAEADTFLA
jgi:hypothetical protein